MTFATNEPQNMDGLSETSRKILDLRDAVFALWEERTRRHIDGAENIRSPILINTLPVFYDNIAEALTPNFPRATAVSNTDIAEAHGNERARMTSYRPDQVIYEYQIFRDAFTHVLGEAGVELSRAEWSVFQKSIDLAVRQAVKKFTEMHDTFRHRVAAAMSHDMRAPLAAMVQGAQLVSLAPQAANNTRIARKMIDNGERLAAMVEELLEAMSFSHGEKLPLVLSRFDIHALADSTLAAMDGSDSRRFDLSGGPIFGHWCANSMRRAIENLVANAVKYGDGKTIRIAVEEANGRMLLSVHNSGSAIASKNRSRIFEYFGRAEGAENPGWGIGLPFVRGVAESHGGSVVVDSSPASGTTFIIDVPLDCRRYVGAPEASAD